MIRRKRPIDRFSSEADVGKLLEQVRNTPFLTNRPRLYTLSQDKWGIAPTLSELLICKIF
jgi:hypothetical protein